MNLERINELEKFAEEFYKKLDEAHLNYEKTAQESCQIDKSSNKKKKNAFADNIFKELPAWKPNSYHTKEFEKLKKTNSQDLNGWQIARVHLLERSYVKEKDLPKGKDILYTKAYGSEFGEIKDLGKLSELGRSIITKFVKDNEKIQNTLKQKEDEIEKYKHSKPPVVCNPWKFTKHAIEEFSKIPVDKIHSFKKEKKQKYLNDNPFRRPKIYGENFEKNIKSI